jgi:transcriptional regulator with XRE-family HTH domain
MKRITSYPTLKTWRLAEGLTQREAAGKLGLSQAQYCQIERGGSTRPKRGKAISQQTGVPFELLVGVA